MIAPTRPGKGTCERIKAVRAAPRSITRRANPPDKFALEGFSESPAKEVAPFGISVTIVEPGPFRTDFLTAQSLRFGDNAVPDYDDRRAQLRAGLEERDGSTTTTLSFLASERCERPPADLT